MFAAAATAAAAAAVVVVVVIVVVVVVVFVVVVFAVVVVVVVTLFTVSALRRELSPIRTLKWLGHNRLQITRKHTGRLSRATCRVPRDAKGQLSH